MNLHVRMMSERRDVLEAVGYKYEGDTIKVTFTITDTAIAYIAPSTAEVGDPFFLPAMEEIGPGEHEYVLEENEQLTVETPGYAHIVLQVDAFDLEKHVRRLQKNGNGVEVIASMLQIDPRRIEELLEATA